jgi:hypothetical protein
MQPVLDEMLGPAIDEADDGEGDDDDDGASARRLAPGRHDYTIEGDGFLRVTHTCRGFGAVAPPIDPEANGALSAVVGFSERGLDPVIWGDFDRCEIVVDDRDVRFDGGVALYVGENLRIGGLGTQPILFQLGATVEVDGDELVDGGFDFQVCPPRADGCAPGTVELLIGAGEGETLVFFVDASREAGGFRGANGTWDCGFDEDGATCQQDGADPVVVAGLRP